jgi:hypothetical protein
VLMGFAADTVPVYWKALRKPRKTSLTGVPTDMRTGRLLNMSEALCRHFSDFLFSRDMLYLVARNGGALNVLSWHHYRRFGDPCMRGF